MSYSDEVLADSPLAYYRLGEASASAPVVAAATASTSVNLSSEAPIKAFDGSLTTKWLTAGVSTGWLRAQLTVATALTGYAVGALPASGFESRNPKNWTFEGSNDGTTWTVLDTQTAQTGWTVGQIRAFTFTNTTAYLYYRLNITANNGNTYVGVSELFLGSLMLDASGNGHNGLYVNTPTLGVTGALTGDPDTAATFASASSEEATVPFNATFNVTTFSLEAWVKTTGTNQALFGRSGGTDFPYALFVSNSGKLWCTIRPGSGNYEGSTVINDGAWHHVAATRDNATGTILLYVDGVLDGTHNTTSAPWATLSTGLAIASRGGSAFLNGSVDEAALYATVVPGARWAAHYAAATGPDEDTGTLAAALPTPTANLSGTYAPPAITGSMDAETPLPTVAMSGTYADPVEGTFALTLPTPTAALSGTYDGPVAGSLAATLPVPAVALSGDYTAPVISGSFDLTLPVPTVALTGTQADMPDALGTLDVVLPSLVDAVLIVGDYDPPLATPPATYTPAVRVEKAIAYPQPILVNGRAT